MPPAAASSPMGAGTTYTNTATADTSGGPAAARGVLGWVKGHLLWLAYQGIGAVLVLPVVAKLLVKLILNPRKTLHREDRSQLQLPDPLPGLTHEFIETEPGVRLHAVRTSKGSGKPLMLLVHGFPEAWFSWRHQMREFRDRYEVVAIDMRGYNESSKPQEREAYRLDRLAGDVTSVTQHLLRESGQKQLVLVGHDWGAILSWAAAHTAPHLFCRLAILCGPHPNCFFTNMDFDQFCKSWYILAFQLPWLAEAAMCAEDYQRLQDMFTTPPFGPSDPNVFTKEDVERHKQAFGRPGAATPAINFYRSIMDTNSRSPMPALQRALNQKLTVPTLLLWAEKDPALGQQLLRGTERHVERLRVVVLPGCSHWAQQDQPEEVNRLLTEHLAA